MFVFLINYSFTNVVTSPLSPDQNLMGLEICCAYPVTLSYSKSRSFFHIRFEELVGEMLCEECKHQAGSLGVRDKLSPHQKLLGQYLCVR